MKNQKNPVTRERPKYRLQVTSFKLQVAPATVSQKFYKQHST